MSAFGWYRPWLTSIQATRLSAKAKGLAAVLAAEERDGVVRAATSHLAKLTSLDPKTVRRALDELLDAGHVERRRSRNVIEVHLRAPESRTGTTPVLTIENGHHARSRTGTTPDQNGHHARSRTGTTPVAYVPTAVPTEATSPPNPPKGGRRRDREVFDEELHAWAAAHFPAAAPSKVVALAAELRRRGIEPTPDAMREFGRQRPVWSLEPTAAAA